MAMAFMWGAEKKEQNDGRASRFYVTVNRVGVFELIQGVLSDHELEVLAPGS